MLINVGSVQIINKQTIFSFIQTLLMDQVRFLELRDKVSWLTLTTSVLIVTYNTVGGAIAGLAELKTKLTHQITVITKGFLVRLNFHV